MNVLLMKDNKIDLQFNVSNNRFIFVIMFYHLKNMYFMFIFPDYIYYFLFFICLCKYNELFNIIPHKTKNKKTPTMLEKSFKKIKTYY